MLPETGFREGKNKLQLFSIEDNADSITLHPFQLPDAQKNDQNESALEKGTYFDGEKLISRRIELSKDINFEIEVEIRSNAGGDQFYHIGEDTPPMPMLVGPVAVYENLTGYTIGVKDRSGKVSYIEIECRPEEWQTIKISKLADGIHIDLNGVGVGMASGEFNFPSRLTLGRGYKERRWRGWISRFSVEEVTADGTKRMIFELP